MSQADQPSAVIGRSLVSILQSVEAIRNDAVRAVDRRTVLISEAGRRNALQKIIGLRKLRSKIFPSINFSDPFWEIILSLSYDSKIHRISFIKSICVESGLPNATALRYLDILTSRGVVYRSDDPKDGRRSLVSLTDESINSVDALLDAWIQDLILMKLSELDFELVDSFQA